MKHTGKYILAVILILSFGCTRPRYFTNYYTGEYTGLDTLINIQGFYYFERNDSSNSNYCIMFYDNGLFIDTHTSKSASSLTNYFTGNMPHTSCEGTYYLDKDTLKTQAILDYGWLYGIYVIFKDYEISSNGELSFIKEYMLEDRKIGFGNLNKRDFKPKKYLNPGKFFPLEKSRSTKMQISKEEMVYR